MHVSLPCDITGADVRTGLTNSCELSLFSVPDKAISTTSTLKLVAWVLEALEMEYIAKE